QQLSAVVARSNRHAFRVQDGGEIVRMYVGEGERNDTGALLQRRSEYPQPRDLAQALEGVGKEGALVLLNPSHAHRVQELDRGAQPDRSGDVGCSGLESKRKGSVGRSLQLHLVDHVAASEKRRNLLEQLAATPEAADPGRPAHLVAREGEEVAAQLPNVHRDRKSTRLNSSH